MSSALRRGRTLNPDAVERAKRWKEQRIRYLLGKDRPNYLTLPGAPTRLLLSPKERSEARRLTGRWDFWNYGKETE